MHVQWPRVGEIGDGRLQRADRRRSKYHLIMAHEVTNIVHDRGNWQGWQIKHTVYWMPRTYRSGLFSFITPDDGWGNIYWRSALICLKFKLPMQFKDGVDSSFTGNRSSRLRSACGGSAHVTVVRDAQGDGFLPNSPAVAAAR